MRLVASVCLSVSMCVCQQLSQAGSFSSHSADKDFYPALVCHNICSTFKLDCCRGMIAYRFADEGREEMGREGSKGGRNVQKHNGGEERREYKRRDGRKEREGKRVGTKEEDYIVPPETFSTIYRCCFTISLVPMTTVLDPDARISHKKQACIINRLEIRDDM